ncbi:hypothetical protein WMF44_15315 [Sorangium sp. So ce426]
MGVRVPAEHAEHEALAVGSQIIRGELREDGRDVLVAPCVLWVARRAVEHLAQILDVDALAAGQAIEALDEEDRSVADRRAVRKLDELFDARLSARRHRDARRSCPEHRGELDPR